MIAIYISIITILEHLAHLSFGGEETRRRCFVLFLFLFFSKAESNKAGVETW